MIHFFKLIRWSNLLIIAATLYMVRHLLLYPFVQAADLSYHLTESEFFMLVFSYILIAAGGNMMNDYHDLKADVINKPENMIVGRFISKKKVMLLYVVFTVIGLLLGLLPAFKSSVFQLYLISVLFVGFLWFYNSEFKYNLFLGNVIIAMLCGIGFLIPLLYEMPLLIKQFKKIVIENEEMFLMYKQIPLNIQANIQLMWIWTGIYAALAFVITLVREMIKDAEDIEGDNAAGYASVALKYGFKTVNVLSFFLLFSVISFLSFAAYQMFVGSDYYSAIYLILFLVMPLLYICFKVIKSKSKRDYSQTSKLLKWMMALALGYLFVFYYQMI